jgi:deoxyadenosine/deoxycytidine kinase
LKQINRIEVCGGIASGKTTFASLFKISDVQPVYEDFTQNPFWKLFYSNPGNYNFETEITFALLHYHQIKRRYEQVSNIIACDFSFCLDLAYSRIGLYGSQLEAFEEVCSQIYKEVGLPSLLVHLRCDAETQLDRIRNRGRAEERSINLDFLDSLNKAVEKEVSIIETKCPVITIDSAIKDFANDENTKKEMVDLIQGQIQKIQRTRISES